MEIYLLRHGTTEWNRERRLQGRTDTELDPLGLEMARLTGEYFREHDIRFDRVYSSPLSRALQTAKLACGHSDILTDPRLAELCFGTQEGQLLSEMTSSDSVPFRFFKTDPALYDRLTGPDSEGTLYHNEEQPPIHPDPTAESLTELCRRTAEFLQDTVEPASSSVSRILISAHGVCNKGLLMYIRKEADLSRFWGNGLQPNCGVDVIEYNPHTGKYTILQANQIFYPETLTVNFFEPSVNP